MSYLIKDSILITDLLDQQFTGFQGQMGEKRDITYFQTVGHLMVCMLS